MNPERSLKRAVVLFNLGGPDRPAAVRPFLFNLFCDPAIIGLPQPFRWLLAKWISSRRAPQARAIYAHMGGSSPLLAETQAQADALEFRLNEVGDVETKVFIAMRYWHPFAHETAAAVRDFDPDAITLLPLYPQFSTTTTGSSLADWQAAATAVGIHVPQSVICCYPEDAGWIDALARRARSAVDEASRLVPTGTPIRVLFSAHGLPQKIIDAGDPYVTHVERTAQAVVDALGKESLPDWRVCYQSRVGPLKWTEPAIDTEIARAANDGCVICVVPIAFVSEHSETLVELDIEYRALAESLNVAGYVRAPAVGTDAAFINGLADRCRAAEMAVETDAGEGEKASSQRATGPRSLYGGDAGGRVCSTDCGPCPHPKTP